MKTHNTSRTLKLFAVRLFTHANNGNDTTEYSTAHNGSCLQRNMFQSGFYILKEKWLLTLLK